MSNIASDGQDQEREFESHINNDQVMEDIEEPLMKRSKTDYCDIDSDEQGESDSETSIHP